MENIFLWIPIVIYVAIVTFVFIKSLLKNEASTAEKTARGTGDYKGILLLFTILGTMIGPGFSYGAIEEFYKYGFFYTGFFILACVQFWFFGHLFAGRIRKIGESNETAGDILGKAYGKPMQILVGFLTVAFSIAIVAVLGSAGGKVLSSVTGLDTHISVIAVITFVTIYSFFGGIATVIKTDKPQFIFVLAFCLIGVGVAIYYFFFNHTTVDFSTIFYFNTNQMPVSQMINIAIAFLLGEAFIPVYSIRGMIAKDENTAKKAFKRAAYIGIIWFILLTFIANAAHCIDYNSNKLVYLDFIQSILQGTWWGMLLIGLALAGMLSVVMSTIDSILNSAGVSFRKDIMQQIFPAISKSESQMFVYSRYAILLVAIFGVFFAIKSSGIVELLLIAYAIWVPAVVFPFVYYLIRNKINNKWSGFCGTVSGIITWVIFNYFIKCISYPLPKFLVSLHFFKYSI